MPAISSPVISLRSAQLSDAVEIAALADRIWRIHYPPIIGHEQVDYMLSTMHSADKIAEQMRSSQSYSFIESDGNVVGYTATSSPASGELFIHKFYVHPQEQGRGIGKLAFREIMEMNPGTKTIRLTVNRKNYKSINFYFRLGFTIEEVKDFDIGNGYFMNDFVMKFER